jgi:hypothetical protein
MSLAMSQCMLVAESEQVAHLLFLLALRVLKVELQVI